jgi:hypothetical protein
VALLWGFQLSIPFWFVSIALLSIPYLNFKFISLLLADSIPLEYLQNILFCLLSMNKNEKILNSAIGSLFNAYK